MKRVSIRKRNNNTGGKNDKSMRLVNGVIVSNELHFVWGYY